MSGGERGGKLRKTGCWFEGIWGEDSWVVGDLYSKWYTVHLTLKRVMWNRVEQSRITSN